MASRFWVGGTANWDATVGTKWATTSGGAGGAAAPTASDDVFFDANSGAAVITIPAATTVTCQSIVCTGYTGTLAFAATTSTMNVGSASGGALTFVNTMTLTLTGVGTINLVSTSNNGGSGWSITTGGLILPNVTFNGTGGSWLLASSLNTGSTAMVTLTAGTLNTNSVACSCGWFNFNNSGTKTLTLGASSITLNGTNTNPALNCSSIGTTITSNTATFTLTSSGSVTIASSLNFNGASIVVTGAGLLGFTTGGFTGILTVANYTRTGTAVKTDGFSVGGSLTVTGTLTLTGNSPTNRLLVQAIVVGSAQAITAQVVSITNVDFMDIHGAGAAIPFTGTSLGDCQGNTNITFDAAISQTWSGNTTGNWSTAANWTSRVPLPQDNVVINGLTSNTLTMDMPRMGANITLTGSTGGNLTLGVACSFFGNLTLVSAVTLGGGFIMTAAGRGSQTIATGGNTFGANALTINAVNGVGTYTLQDAMTLGAPNVLNVTTGTFTANNFNVTLRNLTVGAGATLNMGSGLWKINTSLLASTLWNASATATINASTSTINLTPVVVQTNTFIGGGKIYNNLTYTGGSVGALAITGANTFASLNIGTGRVVTFPSSTTTTLTNTPIMSGVNNGYLYLPGVVANYVSIPSSTALQLTGDMTIDVKCALDNWTLGTIQALISKFTVPNRSYALFMNATAGTVNFQVSADGTASIVNANSTAAVGFANGAIRWIRVTYNHTTGATIFYTSTDGTTFTQLGTTVSAAATSIFVGTSQLEIGSYSGGGTGIAAGKFYEARIYSDTSQSTLVFDANFTTKSFGANTFTESSTNAATVTINGAIAQAGDGRILINSSTPGTQATLSKASGLVSDNYLSVQDSKATGGAAWYAGANSTNAGNNNGWIFSSPPASNTFLSFFG